MVEIIDRGKARLLVNRWQRIVEKGLGPSFAIDILIPSRRAAAESAVTPLPAGMVAVAFAAVKLCTLDLDNLKILTHFRITRKEADEDKIT